MSYTVELYIYDLSQGMARTMVPMLIPGLNFEIDGIWHTAIVVHGYEWFFGSGGVEKCRPGGTMLGQPLRKEVLGQTTLSFSAFNDYVYGLGQDQFAGDKYDLFKHNCNTFSNVVSNFLCSKSIPQYILDLPERVMATPIAQIIRPFIERAAPHDIGEHPTAPSRPTSSSQFSMTEYKGFNSAIDKDKLFDKLNELNVQDHKISGEDMIIIMTMEKESEWWPKIRDILEKWKPDTLFPILDLLRHKLCSGPFESSTSYHLFAILKGLMTKPDAPETVVRLSLRILTNFFLHDTTRKLMKQNREDVIGCMNEVVEGFCSMEDSKKKHSELAAATVAMNYSVLLTKEVSGDDRQEGECQLLSSLLTTFKDIKSPEAMYRCLVGIGTVLSGNHDLIELAKDLGVGPFLRLQKGKNSETLNPVVTSLITLTEK